MAIVNEPYKTLAVYYTQKRTEIQKNKRLAALIHLRYSLGLFDGHLGSAEAEKCESMLHRIFDLQFRSFHVICKVFVLFDLPSCSFDGICDVLSKKNPRMS